MGRSISENPPHIFAIAEYVYSSMMIGLGAFLSREWRFLKIENISCDRKSTFYTTNPVNYISLSFSFCFSLLLIHSFFLSESLAEYHKKLALIAKQKREREEQEMQLAEEKKQKK